MLMRYHAVLLSGTTAITTTPPHPQQLYTTITTTTTIAADLQRDGHHGAERISIYLSIYHRGERRAVRLLRERIVLIEREHERLQPCKDASMFGHALRYLA